LENCLDYRQLQEALDSLPDTLDETYARILNAIPSRHKQMAIRILQFLAFSERPLRIEEVVEVIAVGPKGDPRFDPRNRMPESKEISRYCSSLVAVVRRRTSGYHQTVVTELQLSHFSVKEYLTSNRLEKDLTPSFQEMTAKASIATICLAYLLQLDGKLPVLEIRENFPLAQYCARYWMSHAAVTEGGDAVLQGFIEELFSHCERPYTNCYRLYSPERRWEEESVGEDKPATALYYASLEGLANTVKNLIVLGANVNAQGGCFGNALQAASYKGHGKIVQALLDKGADVNAQGGYFDNALQAASDGGHEKIVQTLLDKGADVHAQGGYFGNALQAASYGGHEKTVQTLLDKGAEVNAQGGYSGNALQAASYGGHEKIVQTLLDKGADYLAQGGYFGNALQAASYGGHEKIVLTLLDKGADVHAQGGHFGNALQAASDGGHEKIVQTLLDKGADFHAQGGYFGNALQAASYGGHEKTVQTLLDKGAEVNAQGGEYGNALQAASCGGHEKIVQTLLNKGALSTL